MNSTNCFHEDVFYEYFRPLQQPESQFAIWGGYGLETFGDDFRLIHSSPEEFVWTVLDGGERSDQWIVPGLRYVNRVCYLMTEVSHMFRSVEFRVETAAKSLTTLGLKRRMSTLRNLMQ